MNGRRVPHLGGAYGRLLGPEVIDIWIMAFVADLVTGVLIPTFPLYATSLGASLRLLGFVTSALGVTRLFSAVPVGLISDRLQRKTVITLGMITFGLSCLVYAAAPAPLFLVPARILQALAMVATLPLGVAYIGDVVEARDRPVAIGVYTAAMAVGFAVGPLLGTWATAVAGYRAAFLVGGVVALAGAVHAASQLLKRWPAPGSVGTHKKIAGWSALYSLLRHPVLLIACVAQVLMTLSLTGAIFTYFPVYARSVGLGTVAIGSIFTWRGLASAAGRIPMSTIARRVPPQWLMLLVLVVEAGIDFGISRTRSEPGLLALMVVEGVGYEIFLVCGQSAVAVASDNRNRGAAVGLFWMASAIGEITGPIGLGLVAQHWGVVEVFRAAPRDLVGRSGHRLRRRRQRSSGAHFGATGGGRLGSGRR